MKQVLTLIALLLAGHSASAEVVDIRWSEAARFQHTTTIAPGGVLELCGRLPAGLHMRWDFAAAAPLDFNVHYHLGKEVVFPAQIKAVAKASDSLVTNTEQEYCWMWSNTLTAPTTLSVLLQR